MQRFLLTGILLLLIAPAVQTVSASIPFFDESAASAGMGERTAGAVSDTSSDDLTPRLGDLSPIELDEVVWLARAIYSESDRPAEQELVAWVVRNRVETRYRGTTYREVVLETKQFSAFNQPTQRRDHILGLKPSTPFRPWQRALDIALEVYHAPSWKRPFAQSVRHFYSPVSMVGGGKPYWSDSGTPLSSARLGVDRHRFVFFDDVDSQLASSQEYRPRPSLGPGIADGNSRAVDSENTVRSGSSTRRSGVRLRMPKPSGKVSRPRRPSVQAVRSRR